MHSLHLCIGNVIEPLFDPMSEESTTKIRTCEDWSYPERLIVPLKATRTFTVPVQSRCTTL